MPVHTQRLSDDVSVRNSHGQKGEQRFRNYRLKFELRYVLARADISQ